MKENFTALFLFLNTNNLLISLFIISMKDFSTL